MTKPLSTAPWATDTNYPAGSEPWANTPTKVAPVAGKLALGYEPDEKPPAQTDNYWRNLVHQWIAYLDTGVLEGNVTIGGMLHADLGITVAGSVEIDVDLSVGGDVEVGGDVVAGGAVEGSTLHHTAQDTIRVPSSAAQVVASGGPTYAAGAWLAGTSTGQLWYPIALRTNERIKSWALFAQKASGSGTITATLVRIDSVTGASTTIGVAQTNSAASPGVIVLGEIGLDELVTGDVSYAVVVTGGGTAGDTFRDLQVNVTRPSP